MQRIPGRVQVRWEKSPLVYSLGLGPRFTGARYPVQSKPPLQLPSLERGMHTATRQVLNYFDYQHLPEPLYSISQHFHDLAHELAEELDGPEFTVCLRKLLEAKDCAVRASLPRA